MERHRTARLRPQSAAILGIALSACVGAVSAARPPGADESRTLQPAAPGAVDPALALRPSRDRASAASSSHGRVQPADARHTLRSPRQRPSKASAARVYAEVDRRTRALDAPLRARIAKEIVAEAARARLDPLLVVALIHVESSFDPDAVSTAGAAGLMQLRERTMADVAARSRLPSTNPLDPVANIQAGVRYLARLIEAFGDPELALMAYNAGPGRIRRYMRDGDVPERFRAYPESVARELERIVGLPGAPDPSGVRVAVNDLQPPRE
jgi:soluble lytic murein transglycosylase-like protein